MTRSPDKVAKFAGMEGGGSWENLEMRTTSGFTERCVEGLWVGRPWSSVIPTF